MALKTISIAWVPTFILISLLLIAPFTQASRPMDGSKGGNMVSHYMNSQMNDFHRMFPSLKSKSLHIPLASERQVPTGPDPLHHHDHHSP